MPVNEPEKKKHVPEGLWTKCPSCQHILYKQELAKNLHVCSKCGEHLRMSARDRIAQLMEEGTFVELGADLAPRDPLEFSDTAAYSQRLKESRKKTGMKDAAIAGEGRLGPHRVALCVLDFAFMGGSMGSVVGEKVTLAAEHALKEKLPLLIVSSSGGARMQEGIISLMQMAKTSAALSRLAQARLPFISVITDPTTGGVTASFAMLGDVIVAEPKALVAFAGPRVIEQTIRQTLPQGFQQSEFLLKHGMIDMVVHRKDLKETLVRLFGFLMKTRVRKTTAA